MKKLLLLLSFCFYATIYNVATAAESVLWEEDFSSYSAGAVPTGGLYSYSCTVSGTKIYDANLAGSTSPELLIAKNGGTFSATIPMNGISGEMTLSFYSNRKITITATNATIGETTISGKQCSCIVKVAEGVQSITLEFKNTDNKNNVRFDSVKLAQELSTQVDYITVDPAFGDIEIGKTITVDCQTEKAVLKGKIGNNVSIENQSFPYTYTIRESDLNTTLHCVFEASKEGMTSSKLEGDYTVVAPTPAAPVFSIEGGEVNNKTEVTITSETGSTLSLYLGEVIDPVASTTEGSIKYTISGSAGEIIVLTAKVTNVYGNESSATYTFSILNPKASKTATWRIVGASGETLKNDVNSANGVWTAKQTDGKTFTSSTQNPNKTGAVAQLGSSSNSFNGTLTLSNSDLTNISFIQSITVTAISYKGKTTTVTAVIGETESYPQVVAAADGTISTTANIPSITFSPIDIQSDKISFNISSDGGTLIKAISIVYRDDEHPFADEATYIKLESGKSVEEGNFVVLSYDNIAVSRADASQGVEVTLSDDGDIVLAEGQNSIDELEVVSSGNTINGKSCFYLYGGVDNGVEKNRHYLGTPSFVTNETEAAEFYVDDAALLRYAADGEYLAYVGGAFVKSADSAGAVTLYVNDSGITTDVEAVEIEDADAPVEYYNLQGVRVANPQNGLYIVRQGNKVSKQIIR